MSTLIGRLNAEADWQQRYAEASPEGEQRTLALARSALLKEAAIENESLRQLVIEAYPGEYPTNGWRQRAEKLGAWPGASVASSGAGGTEFCWLIERGQSENHSPILWCIVGDSAITDQWTQDAWAATRYVSKADADTVIYQRSRPVGEPWARAVEHGFGP